jgi:aldehyde:ferredoxin oxidoreductase
MKFIKVDMTTQDVTIIEVPEKFTGFGGRELTSHFINDQVPPDCNPVGADNKLILAPGILSGTSLVNTGRLSIGAKSPLTGGIKESNVGGTIAHHLARMNVAAVTIEGQPRDDRLFILRIDENGKATLIDASGYKGLRTYRLVAKLTERYGRKNGILCIGPAGESLMNIASIQASDTDGRPCRAAGRGGLGAVMGAKGIKAIVVDAQKKKPVTLADPENFKESAKKFASAIRAVPFSGKALPAFGTAALMGPVNSLGAFPCYNATQGVFENWEKIGGEALAARIQERGGKTLHSGCSQCIINCSNEYVDETGAYVTSSLEYETLWAAGGMCGIDDLDVIARMDYLCDDIGVDTISTGVAIAIMMDAGRLKFGDGEAALGLMEEINRGSKSGHLLGSGPVAVGKHLGHSRVAACKGQSIAAYDPRGIQGMAVTYATCPMGADHTAGNLIGESLSGKIDPLVSEGQVALSRNKQLAVAGIDALGLCLFTAAAASGDILARLVNAKLGTSLTPQDLENRWRRIVEVELEFNRKAGFTRKDDRLPDFFYREPLPPHNKVVQITGDALDRTFDF